MALLLAPFAFSLLASCVPAVFESCSQLDYFATAAIGLPDGLPLASGVVASDTGWLRSQANYYGVSVARDPAVDPLGPVDLIVHVPASSNVTLFLFNGVDRPISARAFDDRGDLVTERVVAGNTFGQHVELAGVDMTEVRIAAHPEMTLSGFCVRSTTSLPLPWGGSE